MTILRARVIEKPHHGNFYRGADYKFKKMEKIVIVRDDKEERRTFTLTEFDKFFQVVEKPLG